MSGETSGGFVDRHQSTIRSLRRGWNRFTRQRLGVIGLGILLGLILVAAFAPVVAPHPPDWAAPEETGSCPEGQQTLDCLSQAKILHPAPPQFGAALGDPYFAPLGTDHRGYGVLSRLIYGTRITLYIGLAAGLLASLVGIPMGLISGFYGDSWIDETIQRVIDVVYALPFLPLLIVFVAIFGESTTNVILAIVLKSWLNNAIVIRGETLSLKERPYIEAAKVAGASDLRIIFRHILPNVLPLGFIYLAQDAAAAIIAHASLAFLGYADPAEIAWGTMLQWVQVQGAYYSAPWWVIPPGIMITLIAASFYFVGYSLEDVTNPNTNA